MPVEIEPAVRRHLLGLDAVRAYVQDRIYTYTLHNHVSPHGHRAIVVRREQGWARPEPRTTSEFPLLFLDVWADRSRTPEGHASTTDEVNNAYAVYRVVDQVMQGRRDETWGAIGTQRGLPIISSERWSEPYHQNNGASGNSRAVQALPYGVPLQDACVVTVAYAIHTHH